MLLDTCTILWLASGGGKLLSEDALSKIETSPFVYISAISGFDSYLEYKGYQIITYLFKRI
jgi:PIN domain nuclease of toxin-antitoxin system